MRFENTIAAAFAFVIEKECSKIYYYYPPFWQFHKEKKKRVALKKKEPKKRQLFVPEKTSGSKNVRVR